MTSGIYVITNTVTGGQYVGLSTNVAQRWQGHQRLLAEGVHHNQRLQTSWNEYGAAAHTCDLLEEVCDEALLHLRETEHMQRLRPAFNIMKGYVVEYKPHNPVARQTVALSFTLTSAELNKLEAIVSMRHPLRNRAQSMTVAELINEEYERSRQQRMRDASEAVYRRTRQEIEEQLERKGE